MERGKPKYPEKNLPDQRREPTTNSTHIWGQRQNLNPGDIGGSECSYHRATLGCIRFLSTGREWGGEGRARATPMRLCANISVAIVVQQYPLTYSCQSRLPSHTFTAISREVVGKNVHATIPKGNMRYDQYTVPGTVTVKNSFVAFLSTRKHTSMASRAILSNFCEEQRTQNHPQSLSGLSRALFRRPFSE